MQVCSWTVIRPSKFVRRSNVFPRRPLLSSASARRISSKASKRMRSPVISAVLPPPRRHTIHIATPHAANVISIPPHSSYGYCRRPCAPSRLSLSPSSRARTVLPKSLAPVLPLAIHFKDVSNDFWSDELTERPSASVLTSPGSCATAQFTPRSRGIKMLAFRVDTVEKFWLDCKIHSSVWIEHPRGISTMPTKGSSTFE
jgi:hypothetical protein